MSPAVYDVKFVPPLATANVADNPAAVPVVFWFPAAFTPGKLMFAVPSNDTPPIFLAVAKAVAVAALPVVLPDDPDVLPVTLPVKFPVIVPPAVIAPVATAPVVVNVLEPILILPKPEVIEPVV